MSDPIELRERLRKAPLAPLVRGAILHMLWDGQIRDKANDKVDPYDAYFVYYEAQCISVAGAGVDRLWAKDHAKLMNIVEYLKSGEQTRESLAICLHEERAVVDDSVTLAARLWLMLHVGNLQHSYTPGQTVVEWNEGTLKACVDRHFSPTHILDTSVKLPKGFNAFQLRRIAGTKVAWTNNLADHLLLREDDSKVLIFHHASFLRCYRNSRRRIYNLEFIDETLKTLKLLLPQHDKKVEKWYFKKQRKYKLDSTAVDGYLNTEARQIESFHYWRDRLVIIKQVFDESERKTIGQWWKDRRKGVQWSTFWVAVIVVFLTILFGLAQTIEGALQVYNAYYPTKSP